MRLLLLVVAWHYQLVDLLAERSPQERDDLRAGTVVARCKGCLVHARSHAVHVAPRHRFIRPFGHIGERQVEHPRAREALTLRLSAAVDHGRSLRTGADAVCAEVPFGFAAVVIVIPTVETVVLLGLGSWRGKFVAFSNGLRCFRTLVIKGHDEYQVGNRNALGDRAALAVDDRAGKLAASDGAVVRYFTVERAAGDGTVVGDLAGKLALFDDAVVIEHRTLKLGDALIATGDLERGSMI